MITLTYTFTALVNRQSLESRMKIEAQLRRTLLLVSRTKLRQSYHTMILVVLSRVEESGLNKKYKEVVHKYQTLLRYGQLATIYLGSLQETEVVIHPS